MHRLRSIRSLGVWARCLVEGGGGAEAEGGVRGARRRCQVGVLQPDLDPPPPPIFLRPPPPPQPLPLYDRELLPPLPHLLTSTSPHAHPPPPPPPTHPQRRVDQHGERGRRPDANINRRNYFHSQIVLHASLL